MKKKIIVALVVLTAFVLSGVCIYFMEFRNRSGKLETSNEENVLVKEKIDLELGANVPTFEDFKIDSNIDGYLEVYFNDEVYKNETLDNIGEYKAILEFNGEKKTSFINVYDKVSPVLTLNDVVVSLNDKYDVDMFVKECSDNSNKECLLSFKDDLVFTEPGEYSVTVVARDESGNETFGTAKLTIEREKPKKVETKKEVTNEAKQAKYGVTENVTTTTTYDVYSDGSIKNKKTKSTSTFDYSSYNAKAKDLIPEAKENRQKYASFVTDILNNANAYRAEVGANPLVLDEELTLEAMVRALESAYTGGKYKHDRPDGSICFDISVELGMKEFWGENLAWGQKDGVSATRWWRNSPGHYANMVNPYSTKLGVGVMRLGGKYYYVQVFA